jgi:hypothetical protein
MFYLLCKFYVQIVDNKFYDSVLMIMIVHLVVKLICNKVSTVISHAIFY